MGSAFFTNIGLEKFDLGIFSIIIFILLIAVLVLTVLNTLKINRLTYKYSSFMRGRSAKSLENEIAIMFDENRAMKEDIYQSKKDIKIINKQLSSTFQKMGMIKYDAFSQMGGKLSYCLAMLDQFDNGFLINSVHTTEGCYSYIKRITDGKCKMDLTNEEATALAKAVQGDRVHNEAGEGKQS